MARLQILELPEGTNDDRPPFILVIDQAPRDEPLYQMFRGNLDLTDSLAEQVGARAVLVFEDTIDIPANDTTAYLDAPTGDAKSEVTLGGKTTTWTHADELRARAVDAAQERDAQAAELERLRAGEEPVTDTRVTPTPAQWIWQWNRATPDKRLDMAKQILDAMPRANNCFMADHEAQIAHLHNEVARLRNEPTKPDA